MTTLPTPITIAIAIVDPRHGKATRAPRDRRSLSARSTTPGIGSPTLRAALHQRHVGRHGRNAVRRD
jgi:hypothetical protein